MKLVESERDSIATLLAEKLLAKIATGEQFAMPHERIVTEIVELMDDLEDKVDSIVANEFSKRKSEKVAIDIPWWDETD